MTNDERLTIDDELFPFGLKFCGCETPNCPRIVKLGVQSSLQCLFESEAQRGDEQAMIDEKRYNGE